jgi:hypothetical protein
VAEVMRPFTTGSDYVNQIGAIGLLDPCRDVFVRQVLDEHRATGLEAFLPGARLDVDERFLLVRRLLLGM